MIEFYILLNIHRQHTDSIQLELNEYNPQDKVHTVQGIAFKTPWAISKLILCQIAIFPEAFRKFP